MRGAETDVRGRVESLRDRPRSPNPQRETPDARSLREQNRDRFPIAPPQAKPSPFERTDPAQAASFSSQLHGRFLNAKCVNCHAIPSRQGCYASQMTGSTDAGAVCRPIPATAS